MNNVKAFPNCENKNFGHGAILIQIYISFLKCFPDKATSRMIYQKWQKKKKTQSSSQGLNIKSAKVWLRDVNSPYLNPCINSTPKPYLSPVFYLCILEFEVEAGGKKFFKKTQNFFILHLSIPTTLCSSRGEREKEREPNEARSCFKTVSTTQKWIKLLKCLSVLQKKSIQNTATSVIIMNLHYPTIQISHSYF